jgi:lipid A disaccharide synthetase
MTVPKYQSHSETSWEAAYEIEDSADTLRGRVFRCLQKSAHNYVFTGMTDEEMQTALNMNPSTQRPRRIELVESGLVQDSGRIRKTKSGRNAVVWIICKTEPVKKQMDLFT